MKYTKGEWVICGDRYAGEVARDLAEASIAENPVCRINAVRRYPIQHAVFWADVPHECPPLKFGGLYSLRVYARIHAEAGTEKAYQESLREALDAALEECRSPEERAILERHRAGIIGGSRGIKEWKEWEL